MSPEDRARLRSLPSGTDVCVALDNGDPWFTKTRSEPWQLGDGTWVVLLAGRTGGFALSRVEPVSEMPAALEAP